MKRMFSNNASSVRLNANNMMTMPMQGFHNMKNMSIRLMRFVGLLLSLAVFNLHDAGAQTVNKRLYLKTGSALDRTVPTAGTAQTSTPLFKNSVTLVTSGSFLTSNGGSETGSLTSPTTFTPSGSDRLLMVTITSLQRTNNTVSNVTFGGVALTKLGQNVNSSNYKVEMWYLLNPSTTAGSIVVSWPSTAIVTGDNNLEAMVGVSLFSNVDPTEPFGNLATNSGASTVNPSSVTVESTPGDIIVDAISYKANNNAFGTGQTQIFRSGTNSIDGASSYKSASTGTATSTSMSWTATPATAWTTMAIAVKGVSNDLSFTQSPTFCSGFTIKSGSTITVRANVTVSSGTVTGTTIPFQAHLSYGTTTIAEILTATYAAGPPGTLTWTTTLGADLTIPSGSAIKLTLSNDYPSANFQVNFDGTSAISYVELPTTTYINIGSLGVYDAAYAGGSLITTASVGNTSYIRATVSDPFGASDITGLNLSFNSGTAVAATVVNTSTCSKIYEYAWTPASAASYSIQATATEGTEGTVTHSSSTNVTVIQPTLTLTKTKLTPASGNIAVGDLVTYNIAITNNGTNPISTLPLQDYFNADCFSFVSSNRPPTSIAAGDVRWSNLAAGNNLAAGATRNIEVTLRVKAVCATDNTAKVEGAKDNTNATYPTVTSTATISAVGTPVAANDEYCMTASGNLDLSVLANDTDPNLSGFISSNTSGYTVTIVTPPAIGSTTVNGDKTIRFFRRHGR